MAGGGTGGHVIPSLAVAEELRLRGHHPVFIGTRRGVEATMVPRADFPIEWIDIGGLQRVGLARALRTLAQLPAGVLRSASLLRSLRAAAVFSMGGYVAAPVMLAAVPCRIPILAMEPNAMPGLVSRKLGSFVRKALISFPDAASYFPTGRSEITGLPVRAAFFRLPVLEARNPFSVLVTGGSRGSSALNRAARECWPLLRQAPFAIHFVLQSGHEEYESLARDFNESGLPGRVTPFLDDMPAAYGEAHVVVSRAGAGAVSELAAAGKPSILVPFPFAADDHQRHNAAAMSRAGAARLVDEPAFNGRTLFELISELRAAPELLLSMSAAARALAKPGAAGRAADLLEDFGRAR